MSKYKEYLICRERGHKANPMKGATMTAGYNSVAYYVCQYCGTTFWTITETTQHESNPPTPKSKSEGSE